MKAPQGFSLGVLLTYGRRSRGWVKNQIFYDDFQKKAG